ncbi:hypothetical protein [Thermophagus sp. OGC60D27]|uniref:hypothetical protein n=1 Tax=Thermophagus sp. OGC60D27 TaxID=3458415 RepID=UPI004037714C
MGWDEAVNGRIYNFSGCSAPLNFAKKTRDRAKAWLHYGTWEKGEDPIPVNGAGNAVAFFTRGMCFLTWRLTGFQFEIDNLTPKLTGFRFESVG